MTRREFSPPSLRTAGLAVGSLFAVMATLLPAQQTYATASGTLCTSAVLGGCAFGGI